MLSCTSSDTLTRGKYQRVPQNLDNPKNGRTLKWCWTLGHLPYTMLKVFFARRITKVLSVRHNYYYLLALLLIHSLRLQCVCKYLYMLSASFHDRGCGADDPDISFAVTRSTTTFRCPDLLYIIRRNCYSSQGDSDSSFPLWWESMLYIKIIIDRIISQCVNVWLMTL